jgi:hypothetical protein
MRCFVAMRLIGTRQCRTTGDAKEPPPLRIETCKGGVNLYAVKSVSPSNAESTFSKTASVKIPSP